MNDDTIRRLVDALTLAARMRAAQEAFYRRGRKQVDLIEAKQLEKQFDQTCGPLLLAIRSESAT